MTFFQVAFLKIHIETVCVVPDYCNKLLKWEGIQQNMLSKTEKITSERLLLLSCTIQICLKFECVYHELKSCSFPNFSPPEPFQLPLWGVNKDLVRSHSHFLHQQSARETPRPLRSEGIIDSDREQAASPRPCHRLREHNFDFNRTRNIHDYSETT